MRSEPPIITLANLTVSGVNAVDSFEQTQMRGPNLIAQSLIGLKKEKKAAVSYDDSVPGSVSRNTKLTTLGPLPIAPRP
jgi:hypothetical protein